MKYACHDCNKNGIYTELSPIINQRFISKYGRSLVRNIQLELIK
jgi:hypothetical protein